MKYRFNKKYLYITLSILIALCGAILFYYLLYNNSDLFSAVKNVLDNFMPIIYGFCIAYLLAPTLNYIENRILLPICSKLKISIDKPKKQRRVRAISVIITMGLFIYLIYIFIMLVFPQLVNSIQNLYASMPDYEVNFYKWLSEVFKDNPEVEVTIENSINQIADKFLLWLDGDLMEKINKISGTLTTVSTHVFRIIRSLGYFIVGLILAFYMLYSKELFASQIKKVIYAVFPEKIGNRILYEARAMHKTFGGFITGKIIDSAIIGLICFICLTIIGTPYAVLVSVIIGITNVIPFFGPVLGAVPCSLLILIVDPRQCLYFIILIIILQQVDGNIIGPMILGESTGLSGFWVIVAISVFGGLFGTLGMFIGVPVFAVLYSGFKRWCSRMLRKKNLPESSLAYTKVLQIKNGTLELTDNPHEIVEENLEPSPVKITMQIQMEDKNSEDITNDTTSDN